MMTLKNIITISFRCFSTTSVNHANIRKTNFLAKLVYGTKSKKICHGNSVKFNQFPTVGSINKGSGNNKRQDVLNKLFLRHITEMITSEEIISDSIGGCGVYISKVKIDKTFSNLNVYWISNENYFEKVEQIFDENKNNLRHNLSKLNLIGHVPKIKFIRDKDLVRSVEVEKLLSKIKVQIALDEENSETTYQDEESIQENQGNELSNADIEEELPPMPGNVYNLDHQSILNIIQSSMSKSRAPHRFGLKSEINDENNNSTWTSNLPPQTIDFKRYLQNKKMKEKLIDYRDELEEDNDISQYEEVLTDGFTDTFK